MGLLGPSLLHLAAQLQVGIPDVAWIFTVRAAGCALGNLSIVLHLVRNTFMNHLRDLVLDPVVFSLVCASIPSGG